MITYRPIRHDSVPYFPNIKMPILHRVDYNPDHELQTIIVWCRENCREFFYISPGYAGKFVEFEDDEDAVLFALRWM